MAKFEIHITTWIGTAAGGKHWYGRIYIPLERRESKPGEYTPEVDVEREAPELKPDWWTKEDGPYISSQFWTIIDVVMAAKKWFDEDKRFVKPGDKLTVWKGHFHGEDLHNLRHALQSREHRDVLPTPR